jgi:hypothetical protein
MNAEQDYRRAATHALAGFQLIEEGLKTYVGQFHETVRKLLPAEIAYLHSQTDIQDAALGKLVNVFSKINSNKQLVAQLRALVKTRDELAHKAFLHLYGTRPAAEELASKTSTFIEVAALVGELLRSLNAESLKVVGVRPKRRGPASAA